MEGRLIVIEGTDGSGKATQTQILVETLRKEGRQVEVLDFPQYGNWSAVFVEKYLRGEFGSAQEVGPYKASLFYALDRFSCLEKINSWLASGKIIISNRYATSNMAHQAGKIKNPNEREKFLEWLDDLEYNKIGLPKPNIVIFLHMPSEIGQKLVESKGSRSYIGGRKKDLHESDAGHLKDAEAAYVAVAEKYSWEKISCTINGKVLAIEDISKLVYLAAKKAL